MPSVISIVELSLTFSMGRQRNNAYTTRGLTVVWLPLYKMYDNSRARGSTILEPWLHNPLFAVGKSWAISVNDLLLPCILIGASCFKSSMKWFLWCSTSRSSHPPCRDSAPAAPAAHAINHKDVQPWTTFKDLFYNSKHPDRGDANPQNIKRQHRCLLFHDKNNLK